MITTNSPYTTRDSLELYQGKEPKIYEFDVKLDAQNRIEEAARKRILENQQQTWCVVS